MERAIHAAAVGFLLIDLAHHWPLPSRLIFRLKSVRRGLSESTFSKAQTKPTHGQFSENTEVLGGAVLHSWLMQLSHCRPQAASAARYCAKNPPSTGTRRSVTSDVPPEPNHATVSPTSLALLRLIPNGDDICQDVSTQAAANFFRGPCRKGPLSHVVI